MRISGSPSRISPLPRPSRAASGKTSEGKATMTRRHISSGGPWEDVVGYSRAVRVGDSVFVAGTTAAEPDGAIFGGDDGYLQAKRCFEIIERALHQAGAGMRHVVRTRMFVTDIRRWEEFSKAHGEEPLVPLQRERDQ